MVDERGLIAGAESVVDVDHRDAARAGVEHGEQRGDAVERGAVAHARGTGDHGTGGKASHHTRKRALHAGHRHDGRGAGDIVGVGEQPMDARDTRIVDTEHAAAEHLRGVRGLLGNEDVARSRTHHEHVGVAIGFGSLAIDAHRAIGVIGETLGHLLREQGIQLMLLLGGQARHHDALIAARNERLEDVGALSGTVDDLGNPLAEPAGEIGLGIAQIDERSAGEPGLGLLGGKSAGGDGIEQRGDVSAFHGASWGRWCSHVHDYTRTTMAPERLHLSA